MNFRTTNLTFRDEFGNIVAHAAYGLRAPTFQVQITPLEWGIGFVVEWKRWRRHVGVQIGPVSLALDLTGLGTWTRCWPGHLRNEQVWKDGVWK